MTESIACTKFGESKPLTRKNWYFFTNGKRKGRSCRKCTNVLRLERYHQGPYKQARKAPDPLCRHCKQPITGKTAKMMFHADEAHPGCQEARKKHRQDWNKKYAVHRKMARKDDLKAKAVTLKVCPLCGKKRMAPERYFSCTVCEKQAGRTDGNYIYQEYLDYEREEAHPE